MGRALRGGGMGVGVGDRREERGIGKRRRGGGGRRRE